MNHDRLNSSPDDAITDAAAHWCMRLHAEDCSVAERGGSVTRMVAHPPPAPLSRPRPIIRMRTLQGRIMAEHARAGPQKSSPGLHFPLALGQQLPIQDARNPVCDEGNLPSSPQHPWTP